MKYALIAAAICITSINAHSQELKPDAPSISISELYSQERRGAWVYLPATQTKEKIPCIVVPPAGSRMYHGIAVGQGDQAEHTPYVNAGFAVITFDISGSLPDDPTADDIHKATKLFIESDCGIADARRAIEAAIKSHPQIDENKIYIAGHSSAATLALQVAAKEPRIKACIAYAPVIEIEASIGKIMLTKVENLTPGSSNAIKTNSPHTLCTKVACPTLLFTAKNDFVINQHHVAKFSETLKKNNPKTTHITAPSGGHYDSMINIGIPKGIEWLKSLDLPLSK